MTTRGWTRSRAARRPVIVIAGEDSTDRKVLRLLLEAFCTDAIGRVVEVNDTIRLRMADDVALRARVSKLAGSVRARAERENAEIGCVFIQEDLDMIDSHQYDLARNRVQEALDRELTGAHYVLAVWEIEAWLLLFPDALQKFSSSWKVPARYNRVDTGRIADPKRVMRDEVSKAGQTYRPSDAPKIFERVAELRLHDNPVGSNRSYAAFKVAVAHCCGSLGVAEGNRRQASR